MIHVKKNISARALFPFTTRERGLGAGLSIRSGLQNIVGFTSKSRTFVLVSLFAVFINYVSTL